MYALQCTSAPSADVEARGCKHQRRRLRLSSAFGCRPHDALPACCPQISSLKDPNTNASAYVVAEVDVTEMMESQRTIRKLQGDMQSLLHEILPQQARARPRANCNLFLAVSHCVSDEWLADRQSQLHGTPLQRACRRSLAQPSQLRCRCSRAMQFTWCRMLVSFVVPLQKTKPAVRSVT